MTVAVKTRLSPTDADVGQSLLTLLHEHTGSVDPFSTTRVCAHSHESVQATSGAGAGHRSFLYAVRSRVSPSTRNKPGYPANENK